MSDHDCAAVSDTVRAVVRIGKGTILLIAEQDRCKRKPACIHGIGQLHEVACDECARELLRRLDANVAVSGPAVAGTLDRPCSTIGGPPCA